LARQGRPRERTLDNIRAYWEAEAAELGTTPEVTIRDFCFRIHELHTLLPLVRRHARLLDAGCGTGFGTLVLSRRARYALGVDASPTMVAWAARLKTEAAHRQRISRALSPLWELPEPDPGAVEFRAADVLALDEPERPFDVVTAQRLLINLPTPADQRAALHRLRAHAHDDGLLILGETTLQGYDRTDAYRARYGLPALERYWHNLYVDESRFGEWRQAGWEVERTLGFDTYMLLSKVVYPAACGPENCRFLSGANTAAMEIACLFRTWAAAREVGDDALLRVYVDRVQAYDAAEAAAIARWADRHASALPEWSGLGHQKLILARPRPTASS
jgi:SAM-dependent methyltransferase